MKKVKNLDLIIILVVITIIALITAILLAVHPFKIDSFDKVAEVNINNYKTMNKNKNPYFVFLYDKNDESSSAAIVKECVVAYAEYARQHNKVPKIYVIEYNQNKNIIDSSNFSVSTTNIPCLVTITTSGTVSNKKYNIYNICNYLEDYRTGKEEMHTDDDGHVHVH